MPNGYNTSCHIFLRSEVIADLNVLIRFCLFRGRCGKRIQKIYSAHCCFERCAVCISTVCIYSDIARSVFCNTLFDNACISILNRRRFKPLTQKVRHCCTAQIWFDVRNTLRLISNNIATRTTYFVPRQCSHID